MLFASAKISSPPFLCKETRIAGWTEPSIEVIGDPQPFAEARRFFPKDFETIHADSRGQDALHPSYRNILRDTYEFSLSTIILEGVRLFGQSLCSIVPRRASYLNNALYSS